MSLDRSTLIPALKNVATQLRIDSIRSTTEAGSGHPTTCMSAAEIVAAVFFAEMRYDPKDPQNPEADPALLQHHPMRNALTNVVGARPRVDVHVVEETLAGGERLLLSTDGVHGVLDDDQLERIVADGRDLAAVPETLVTTALAHGSRDNCTAVVAQYTRD